MGVAFSAEMAVSMGLSYTEVFGRWKTMCDRKYEHGILG